MQTITEKTQQPQRPVERLSVRRVGAGTDEPVYERVRVESRGYQGDERPMAGGSELEADLRRARVLANWLDAKFNIGGIKFGLDSLVGLIPVAGDVVSFLAGLYPLHLAAKHDLGKILQTRMAGNLLIDFGVGAIPLVGDVFDVGFKANLKNLKLLEAAIEKKLRYEGRRG
jgi:hypothetical protein